MNLGAVFLVGLTTGGLTCLAMQGGLLASVIANQKEAEGDRDGPDVLPVAMFLGAKLISHVILGFGLGALGSVLTLSLGARLVFQILAALFMLATAMNLLQVHPIFRYVVLQPPRFMQRWVRNSSKSKALFAPAALGFLTIFVPCGVTQAMEIVAINSGNSVAGAVTMGAFVLGTSPLFAVLGIATSKFSEFWRSRFLRLAAAALIALAIFSVNGVLTVVDAPVTLSKLQAKAAKILLLDNPYGGDVAAAADGVQRVTIQASNRGYTPRQITVKMGVPVELTVKTNGVYSCASAFTLKKFKIFTELKPIDEKMFAFTPMERGEFTFSCAMGMYSGILRVI